MKFFPSVQMRPSFTEGRECPVVLRQRSQDSNLLCVTPEPVLPFFRAKSDFFSSWQLCDRVMEEGDHSWPA